MILLCFSCNSQQTDLIIYKENEVIPNLIVEAGISESIKDHFNDLFQRAGAIILFRYQCRSQFSAYKRL